MGYDALVIAGLVLLGLALLIVPLGLAVGQQRWETLQSAWWMRLLIQMVILAIAAGFHIGFWVYGGQTLGMRAWRLRVEGDDGSSLSLRDAAIRYLAAWISALPFGLGFLWSLWDPERLAWHDRLSHTRLVLLAPRP
jgi:uncharacterized RDD family membrane protein YckC